MTWTLRRTIVGLAVALLLGAGSFVAYALGEQQRAHVVGQGHRTTAVVTGYERNSGWPDAAEVTYEFAGARRQASIYHPWHAPPPGGTSLDVFVDPADPQRVATADGYATGWQAGLPLPLAAFAVVAALVALSGFVTTVRRQRWDAASIAPEPDAATVAVRRRGVVRRVDVWSWFFFGLLAAGTALGVWANQGSDDPLFYPAVAMFGGAAAGVYVAGTSGRIVITPRHLTVHQTFTVHTVPRGLVQSVHLAEDGVLELVIRNAAPIRVATGAAAQWGAHLNRRPAQLRAANRLRNLLVAVRPAGGGEDESVTRTYRWFTIGLAVLAGAGMAAPFVVMAVSRG
ncbi:hypothetical protein CS0771_05090 [Catellatospora sp. IY07-71]|uniref:DUF3592 domain-containing protein n=1 Tax=Catellatospora sp. IY07-71 TaxID=2728827 RepID=UPI001BB30EAC|nr:hypothetical protein [Catellatospora sp. IY07-71]BCJ70965.1 hypothetical protein CS0771_05090 [Catellatospora sp. IY07-71]